MVAPPRSRDLRTIAVSYHTHTHTHTQKYILSYAIKGIGKNLCSFGVKRRGKGYIIARNERRDFFYKSAEKLNCKQGGNKEVECARG